MTLPQDFWLGAALAATAAEGAAPASDWAYWEQLGNLAPSGEGAGFGTDYRNDVRAIADLGLGHIRLGIDWARIEPENDRVDQGEIERYKDVLATAHESGLKVWVTLVDRSLPGWFSIDEHGWRDRYSRTYLWPRHVERCAEHFAPWAFAWVPVARPLRWARTAYLVGTAPPGRTDPFRFTDALLSVHQAALEAWRVLRGGPPVATCFDLATMRPADREPTTAARVRRAESFQWCWADGFGDGELSLIGQTMRQVPLMREAFDYVGITIENRVVVGEHGPWRREHRPEDIGELLAQLDDRQLDRPVVVLGQEVVTSDQVDEVLGLVEEATTGLDLRGWFAEPAIDGYEWEAGFVSGRGILDRDRKTAPAAERLAAIAQSLAPPDAPDELEAMRAAAHLLD